MVTIATPRSCLPIVARASMEIMTEPLPETPEGTIASSSLPRLKELIKNKDALLLGPGITTHPETAEVVAAFLPQVKIPTLIDADGLNIISAKPQSLSLLPQPCVLTPHPGEFSRLTGKPTAEILSRRLPLAQEFAQKYNLILVLKGYRTLVCSPDGRVLINPTGNPGMASGGTGDVLSGLAASFLMQIKDPLLATAAAVFVHGQSGDLARKKVGERPLVAGDLIRFLPQAMKKIENSALDERESREIASGLISLTPRR